MPRANSLMYRNRRGAISAAALRRIGGYATADLLRYSVMTKIPVKRSDLQPGSGGGCRRQSEDKINHHRTKQAREELKAPCWMLWVGTPPPYHTRGACVDVAPYIVGHLWP